MNVSVAIRQLSRLLPLISVT